jgi:hypothetical protein
MEYLVAELLGIRELMHQCEANASGLFGKDVADELRSSLEQRRDVSKAS